MNILNILNFSIVLVSLLGFLSTLTNYWFLDVGKPGIGALRLLLILASGLLSFFLTNRGRIYAAKLITAIFPSFFLIIFPTFMGDVRNEYYFYYPFSGIALAIIPILLFPNKKERSVLSILLAYCFLLTVCADNLLTYFARSGGTPDFFQGRYFFYKVSQVMLFVFVVLTVFMLKELNTKYEGVLSDQNARLKEQKEELQVQSDQLEALVNKRTIAYKESENRFRSIFENANDAIFIMQGDLFFDCNYKTTEMFRCSKEQIIGRTPYEFSPPAQNIGMSSREAAVIRINNAQQGIPQRFEWQHKRYDNTLFDAEVSLNKQELDGQIFLLAIVRDITERKKSEEALRSSEKKFRDIFEKSRHGIIILGPDLDILAANEAFFEISGFTLNEGEPLYVADLVLPFHQKQMKDRLNMLLTEGNLPPFEYRVKYKDGTIHTVEASSSIIDYNNLNAYLVILRDVTLIKEAEQKVMDAIINTEESERSRIAQDLHDGLGPILSTIKIYFQVYQETRDDNKKAILTEKLKAAIDEAIKGVSEISHNISPHVLRNYGFFAALKQFVHGIEITNTIKFALDFNNEPVLNENSGIILYRAVTELINNSIKHSGCKNISVLIKQVDDFVQIEYRDDGKGFDPASVTTKLSKGSGVRNIINRIRALHGSIDINSTPGQGILVLLKIPV